MGLQSHQVFLRNGLFRFGRATFSILFLIAGIVASVAQRPLGIDVSHYEGTINWSSVKSSGVSFAWAKATEGSGIGDAYFAGNVTGAKAAGVFFGAYHLSHPEANTPATEANYFWSVAGSSIKNDGLTIQPVLDYETFTAPNNIPVGAASYSDWANQWCNAIVSKAAAVGVTVKPIIYTSTCEAGYCNSSVAQWPPWIANPSGLTAQTNSPWNSTTCNSASYEIWGAGVWEIWQYSWTGSVPGISGQCDLDVFNGTSAQMVSALIVGGLTAPYFVSQPINHRATDSGSNLTFSASANGIAPLKYQWLFNGGTIADATNTTLNITRAQPANSGYYSLVVTDNSASGSITSSPVSLLVYPPQVTVFADNFEANTATNWILNKSSADTAVTFGFDYSTLGIPSAPNSANGSTLGLQLKANLANGAVAALTLSPTNKNFPGDYRLRFDGWINVNGPFPGGGLGSTELLTAGVGTSGTRTEWTGNASADGFYFSVNGDGGSSDTATVTADYNAYSGATVQPAATGDYWAGTDVTARGNGNFYYTSIFPGAAAPAFQQSNFPQQASGNLNAGTFGLAWHDVIVSKRGRTVDWVVDGIRLATISNATFTASNVFVGFWDPFASLSSNNVINFGLVDNVRVDMPAAPPLFLTSPLAQTVKLGTNVSFTVAATGLPAPNFQWQFNGTNLFGATNSTYSLAFVAATNTGYYSVVATNLAGATNSSSALLALLPASAAQFQTIIVQNGSLQINFTGDAYWTYTIETSTNLTDWSATTNLTSSNGVFNFTAGPITDRPQQFFRARVGP